MKFKWKIIFLIVVVSSFFIARYALFGYAITSGKKTGTLTELEQKVRYGFFSSWEGTLDDGTSFSFFIRDRNLAEALVLNQNKQVTLDFEQHYWAFPHGPKTNIVSFVVEESETYEAFDSYQSSDFSVPQTNEEVVNALSKTLFCSLLGSIYNDQELYQQVKDHVRENNLYLYNQIDSCNK